MTEKTWPFQTGWLSFELPNYRPCGGTYDFYEYESIPPIDTSLFTGELAWLKAAAEEEEDIVEEYEVDEEDSEEENVEEVEQDDDEEENEDNDVEEKPVDIEARLQKLAREAQELGLVLPEAFLQLLGSPELQENIPSCTACEFELVDKITPYPGDEGGYIIRFLNDQQGVLTWYLYLTPGGEHCIITSTIFLDLLAEPDYVENPEEKWESAAIANQTFFCSPSFEEFIYRFWLENRLWFKLSWNSETPSLTAEEARYVSHYK